MYAYQGMLAHLYTFVDYKITAEKLLYTCSAMQVQCNRCALAVHVPKVRNVYRSVMQDAGVCCGVTNDKCKNGGC